MRFGCFWIMSRRDEDDDHTLLTNGLDQFVAAETFGFDSVWVAEHHFFGYGAISAPGPFLTMVAARTSRVNIGYAVVVSSLHHPILVAEEIAMLDHLSNGRVRAGVGSGMSVKEMDVFGGIRPKEHRGRHFEFIEVVNGTLRENNFSFQGDYFQFENIRLLPRPYQKPFPPVMIAAVSKDSIEWAGRTGTPIMFGRLNAETLLKNRRLYAKAALAAGYPEEWIRRTIFESPILFHLFLDDDAEIARRKFIEPTQWYVDRSESVIGTRIDGFHPVRPVDEILNNYSICGDVQTARTAVQSLKDLGVGNLVVNVSWGGIAHEDTLRSMQIMSKEILPEFQGKEVLPSLEFLLDPTTVRR